MKRLLFAHVAEFPLTEGSVFLEQRSLLCPHPTGLAFPRAGWLLQSFPPYANVLQHLLSRWIIHTISRCKADIPLTSCKLLPALLSSPLLLFVDTRSASEHGLQCAHTALITH